MDLPPEGATAGAGGGALPLAPRVSANGIPSLAPPPAAGSAGGAAGGPGGGGGAESVLEVLLRAAPAAAQAGLACGVAALCWPDADTASKAVTFCK